jgi:O-acetyl-ADP-ribose deacetylase (regulator of RNase III)
VIRFVRGDLFDSGVEALVNPVNCAGVMGAGLAAQFRRRFPANFSAYVDACRRGVLRPGRVFVFDTGCALPRWIVNFPTKDHWRDGSRIEFIAMGLVDLLRAIREHGIGTIAIPALGCGLGGLSWSEVKPRIERALASVPDLVALVFEPQTFSKPRKAR